MAYSYTFFRTSFIPEPVLNKPGHPKWWHYHINLAVDCQVVQESTGDNLSNVEAALHLTPGVIDSMEQYPWH